MALPLPLWGASSDENFAEVGVYKVGRAKTLAHKAALNKLLRSIKGWDTIMNPTYIYDQNNKGWANTVCVEIRAKPVKVKTDASPGD